MQPIDLSELAQPSSAGPPRVSRMASGIVGSEILKIAAEIRAMAAKGDKICNLTVGDFDPKQFAIPQVLLDAIIDAYNAGETNYPPSNGMPELRTQVQKLYSDRLGLSYPLDSVLIAGGARPVIYGIYRTVVDPGDVVVYPAPSWNNNHYVHMQEAVGVQVRCGVESRFLPTVEGILEHLPKARLVCLNSPLNPTGTAMGKAQLKGICDAIVAENHGREKRGERPCYLMYDHIYWMLTAGETHHVTPPQLVPEMARYTIFVDGISKAFAATGVRVGWAVGPTDVVQRMSAILGHVGAWAPRAEQVASAKLLANGEAIDTYVNDLKEGINARLESLHRGFQALKKAGHAVESLSPEGAIYLTVQIAPFGKKTADGTELKTNEDVRKYVLSAARIGIVPFQAFGYDGDEGWFRLSVGAVSLRDAEDAIPRLGEALTALR